MEHDEKFRISLSKSRLNGAKHPALAAQCSAQLSLSAFFILPLWNTVYLPACIKHNSQLSICHTHRSLRSFLPACSCALAQFVCHLALMLYSFLPACLPDLLRSLFLYLLCNFFDLSASLRRHVTNLHAGPTWFLTSSAVCLLCLHFELFCM